MHRSRAPFAFCACLALISCGDRAEELDPVSKAPLNLQGEQRQIAEVAAAQFAEDVREGRADAVAERLDIDAFVRGVCIGTGCTRRVRRDFQEGLQRGLADRTGGLMADFMEQDFRFLRLIEANGATQMLFRAWNEDAGVDYLRCAFDRPHEENWRIVDLYSYAAGEAFSESLRRTFLPVLAGADRARELRERYQPFATVVERVEEEDFAGARRALLLVPDSMRNERFARNLELEVLSRIDSAADEYAAAAERFQNDFPEDPSAPLRLLEVHSIRGEHSEALLQVDQIDEQLGGDPFLHFLRAGALAGLGRQAEAVEGLKLAVQAEPEIEELRWALIHAALPSGDYAVVADALRSLRQDFEYQLAADELASAEEYQNFAKSEPGQALLAEMREQEAEGGEEDGE